MPLWILRFDHWYQRNAWSVSKIFNQLKPLISQIFKIEYLQNYAKNFQMIKAIISIKYPLVNWHSNGISPFSIGNTSSKGPFSIAMLVYRSVITETQLNNPSNIPNIQPHPSGPPTASWANRIIQSKASIIATLGGGGLVSRVDPLLILGMGKSHL